MIRSSQAGFSLVETLIASAVLLIAITGVLTLFPQAYSSAHDSERIARLSELAAAKLDEIRALDYDHADLTIGIHPATDRDDNGHLYYPVPGEPQEYSLRWVVEDGPTDSSGTPVAGMKRISVQATHRVRYLRAGIVRRRLLQSNSREVVFHTMITDDE